MKHQEIITLGFSNERFHDRYVFFMDKNYCSSPYTKKHIKSLENEGNSDERYDSNIVKTVAAFWIRRSMDGTAQDFYKFIKEIVAIYDPNFNP